MIGTIIRVFISFILFVNILFANTTNQNITLQLSWFDQFQFAGYYIAKEKGFYKQEGLDVTIKPFKFGLDIPQGVHEGKYDFAVGRETLILEKANNKDIVALYALFQASPLVLISTKESQIDTIRDFSNKKIMTTIDDSSEVSIKSMITSQNLDLKNLQFIKHTHNINDLIEKKTDVISAYTSKSPYHLQKMGVKYNLFAPKDYGFDMYSDFLYTSKTKLSEDRDGVIKFKKASLKGWEYAYANIEEAVDLIFKKYNPQNLTKEELLFEAKELKKLSYYNTDTLGKIDLPKLQRIYDLYNVMGLVNHQVDLEKFIYQKETIFLSKEEKEYLKSLPPLKVFAIDSNKPLSYIENSEPVGYANELLKLVAKKLGLQIQWIKNMNYEESLQAMKNGSIDMKSIYSYYNISRNFIIPSDTIISTQFSVVGRFDSDRINSIDDLKGKKLVLVKGYQQTLTIEQEYPIIEFQTVDNIAQAYSAVRSLEADYYIDQAIHTSYYIREKLLSDLKIAGELSPSEFGKLDLSFGISSTMPLLQSAINKVLYAMDQEKIKELQSKWLMSKKNTQLSLTHQEQKYLREKKELSVCVQPSWLPYEGIDNNQFIGISADYLDLLSKKLALPLKVITSSTNQEVVEKLKRGECDIKPIAAKGKGQLPYKTTSVNIEDYIALVTKAEQPFIANLNEYTTKKFAVIKNKTRFIKQVKKLFPKIDLVEVDSFKEGFEMVLDDKVFAVFGKSKSMAYHIYKFYPSKLKIINEFKKLSTGIGVIENDPILYSIIEKGLASISEKQKIKIRNDWDIKTIEIKPDYTFFWYVLLILLIILVAFAYKQYLLKRSNDQLEQYQKQLQKEIKQKETINQKLQEAKRIALLGEWSLDLKTMKAKWSDEIIDMLRLENKNFEASPEFLSSMMYQEDWANFEASMTKCINEGKKHHCTYRIKKNDSETIWIECRGELNKSKDMIFGTIQNITTAKNLEIENIRTEKLLVEQSKLASMGEMLGNIAHQWRQPLNVITTSASAIKLSNELNILNLKELDESIDTITKQAYYLSDTIDNFKNFVKGEKEYINTSIVSILEETISLTNASLKNNYIKIVSDLKDDLDIKCSKNELIEAFINIINNSKDVLKENVENEDDRFIFICTKRIEEDKIRILIKDSGGGIPEDIISKVFEPYFTTKHQSQGTGLGLQITDKIIRERLNGEITVYNEMIDYNNNKYKGACFSIVLT